MPMSPADIAAWIGAAAWAPQIAGWIRDYFASSKLSILPAQKVEIGFTSYGPILNLRMAFAAENKPAIVDGFQIELRHEDGETRTLSWRGLRETFSEIRDDSGGRQVVSRDEEPVAVKVGLESLVILNVRFQEPRYWETTEPVAANLVALFNFLKAKEDPDFVAKTLDSKEFKNVLDIRRNAFWWKAGRYVATLKVSSPGKVTLASSKLSFVLDNADADRLKGNLVLLEADARSTIESNLPDYKADQLSWNWSYPQVERDAKSVDALMPIP
jgi:hypothetical protein